MKSAVTTSLRPDISLIHSEALSLEARGIEHERRRLLEQMENRAERVDDFRRQRITDLLLNPDMRPELRRQRNSGANQQDLLRRMQQARALFQDQVFRELRTAAKRDQVTESYLDWMMSQLSIIIPGQEIDVLRKKVAARRAQQESGGLRVSIAEVLHHAEEVMRAHRPSQLDLHATTTAQRNAQEDRGSISSTSIDAVNQNLFDDSSADILTVLVSELRTLLRLRQPHSVDACFAWLRHALEKIHSSPGIAPEKRSDLELRLPEAFWEWFRARLVHLAYDYVDSGTEFEVAGGQLWVLQHPEREFLELLLRPIDEMEARFVKASSYPEFRWNVESGRDILLLEIGFLGTRIAMQEIAAAIAGTSNEVSARISYFREALQFLLEAPQSCITLELQLSPGMISQLEEALQAVMQDHPRILDSLVQMHPLLRTLTTLVDPSSDALSFIAHFVQKLP